MPFFRFCTSAQIVRWGQGHAVPGYQICNTRFRDLREKWFGRQNGFRGHPSTRYSLRNRKRTFRSVFFSSFFPQIFSKIALFFYFSGDIIEENYSNPTWVPVIAREIDELYFELRTLDDQPLPFQWGTIVMTLVFKKSLGM